MTEERKKLTELPFKSCLLCNRKNISIEQGKRKIVRRGADYVFCHDCEALAYISEDGESIKFKEAEMPYLLFGHKIKEWNTISDIKKLGKLIRSYDPKSMDYTEEVFKHVWRINVAFKDQLLVHTDNKVSFAARFELNFSSLKSMPKSNLRLLQKELRQIKKNITADAKAISEDFKKQIADTSLQSRKKNLREIRAQNITPYDDLKLQIDELILELDRALTETE